MASFGARNCIVTPLAARAACAGSARDSCSAGNVKIAGILLLVAGVILTLSYFAPPTFIEVQTTSSDFIVEMTSELGLGVGVAAAVIGAALLAWHHRRLRR